MFPILTIQKKTVLTFRTCIHSNLRHLQRMTVRKSFLDNQPLIVQILFLLGITGICTLIFTAIGMALIEPIFGFSGYKLIVGEMNRDPDTLMADPNKINALKVIQLISSIGLFLAPALIFSIIKRPGGDYIGMRYMSTGFWYVIAVILILCATPLVSWIYHLNQQLNLPSDNLMEMIRSSEDQAKTLTKLFLHMPHTTDLFFNLFLIALLPALSEEFFFRGVLQRLFQDRIKNMHVAVWVAAAVFSFMHLQFLGFLPRMFLGVVLGYLFVFSGSIWVAVVAHMFNNGAQVIAAYLHQRGMIEYNIEDETAPELWVVGISLLLTIALLIYISKRRYKAPEPETTHIMSSEKVDRDDLPFV